MIRALIGLLALLVIAALPRDGLAQTTPLYCTSSAKYDASTNGATQLVALGGAIYVCGYTFFSAGTVNVGLEYGTGTNCATTPVTITPAYQLTAQTGVVEAASVYRGLFVPAGQALCINASSGVAVQAIVYYIQRP